MSNSLILSASFSKITICIYLKAYKNNIFGYRPNYLKTYIIIFLIGFEAFILMVQKFFGAKCVVPKKFRKQGYNYYRKENEMTQEEKEVECVICLDRLKNLVNLDDEDEYKKKEGNIFYKYTMS